MKLIKNILLGILFLVIAVIIFLVIRTGIVIVIYNLLVEEFSSTFSISQIFAKILAVPTLILVLFATKLLISWNGRKRATGALLFFLVVIIFLFFKLRIQNDYLFDPTNGSPLKSITFNRDSTINYHPLNQRYDPYTGEKTKPITRQFLLLNENIIELRNKPIQIKYDSTTILFDPITGAPLYYYYMNKYGMIELFNVPTHPQLNIKLNYVDGIIADKIYYKLREKMVNNILSDSQMINQTVTKNISVISRKDSKIIYENGDKINTKCWNEKANKNRVFILDTSEFEGLRKLRDNLLSLKKVK